MVNYVIIKNVEFQGKHMKWSKDKNKYLRKKKTDGIQKGTKPNPSYFKGLTQK